MTPAEVRWRCERIQQLLARMSRREALAEVAAEARKEEGDRRAKP